MGSPALSTRSPSACPGREPSPCPPGSQVSAAPGTWSRSQALVARPKPLTLPCVRPGGHPGEAANSGSFLGVPQARVPGQFPWCRPGVQLGVAQPRLRACWMNAGVLAKLWPRGRGAGGGAAGDGRGRREPGCEARGHWALGLGGLCPCCPPALRPGDPQTPSWASFAQSRAAAGRAGVARRCGGRGRTEQGPRLDSGPGEAGVPARPPAHTRCGPSHTP